MKYEIEQIEILHGFWFDFKFMVMEFEVLFPDNIEIQKLRERTLPDFFYHVNGLYWNHFAITIAKLIAKDNKSLTLYTLPNILKEKNINDENLILNRVKKLAKKFDNITFHRNKYLAHFDKIQITSEEFVNPELDIEDVKKFLAEMLELIIDTQKLLSIPMNDKNGLIIYPGRYKGSKELLRILKKESI